MQVGYLAKKTPNFAFKRNFTEGTQTVERWETPDGIVGLRYGRNDELMIAAIPEDAGIPIPSKVEITEPLGDVLPGNQFDVAADLSAAQLSAMPEMSIWVDMEGDKILLLKHQYKIVELAS